MRHRRAPWLVLLGVVAVAAGAAHAAGTIGFADPVVELGEAASKSVLVVRTGDASGPATVLIGVDPSPATATLGTDFDVSLSSGMVEFADGETFRRVSIVVYGDSESEGVEYARLALSSPTGAQLGSQRRTLLLMRDGPPTDPSFSWSLDFIGAGPAPRVGDMLYAAALKVATEGGDATLAVQYSPAGANGNVDVAVIGGTATLGVDYADPSAPLAFAAGTTRLDVPVAVLQDAASEGTETVELLLQNAAASSTIGSSLAIVLVEDGGSDRPGRFLLLPKSGANSTISVNEVEGSVGFRVQRVGGTTGAASVDYAAIGLSTGGAVAGKDYVAATGTLDFADGDLETTFSVPIIDDNEVTILKGDFRVVIANPTGGAIVDPGYSWLKVSLIDNDVLCNDCAPFVEPGEACFIATAAYGSYLDPHVAALRAFRDRHLLTNAPGRAFVAWYYRVSPQPAAWIARHPGARVATRVALTPVVYTVEHPFWAGALPVAAWLVFRHRRKRRVSLYGDASQNLNV